MSGAGGIVTISYYGRVPRFKGGAVTVSDGWVLHTFSQSGILQRRWWCRKPVLAECMVIGGGGGASGPHPGYPGKSVALVVTIESPRLTITVGKGGRDGGGTGGDSSIERGL